MLKISFRCVWISYLINHNDISALDCPIGLMEGSLNNASQIWDSFNDSAGGNIYFVIQHHVLILHTSHKRILCQRTLPASKLVIRPHHLCLQRLHIRWQEAIQLELLPLMWRKRRAFVMKGRPKNIGSLRLMGLVQVLSGNWRGGGEASGDANR